MSEFRKFFATIKESSTNNDFYRTQKRLSEATTYLIILVAFISILQSVPLIYDESSSINSDEIPEFEIIDGKLIVYAEQPLVIDENFVVDTTGEITEPIVDKQGRGILITQDTVIYKRPYDERRIEMKMLGEKFSNKEELVFLTKLFTIIIIPFFFVLSFLINLAKYIFIATILGAIGYYVIGRRTSFDSVFSICIFSMTPYIILVYLDSLIEKTDHVGTIGLLWFLVIFISALRMIKGDKIQNSAVEPF